MKGIILVKDFALTDTIQKLFPDWVVLSSYCERGVEFYPLPPPQNN